jgi:type II secretory pathway pseudopilin PulG
MLKKCKAGFSLIELSVILVIVASLAVVALTKYVSQRQIKDKDEVTDDLKEIRDATYRYASSQGYYPCPAAHNIDKESTTATTVNNLGRGQRMSNGYCNTTGVQTVAVNETTLGAATTLHTVLSGVAPRPYLDDITTGIGPTDDIDFLIGDPPCRDLGLPQDCMFAPDGTRYAYVVSFHLAKPYPCNYYVINPAAAPGSAVQDPATLRVLKKFDEDQSLATNYGTAGRFYTDPDFILIYYGPDGIGAYNASGTQIQPKVVDGDTVNDSVYNNVNHNLHDTIDQYFLAPEQDIDSMITALDGAEEPTYPTVFGDVLVLGALSTAVLPKYYCGQCNICNRPTDGRRPLYTITLDAGSGI